ncbi:hypothetical protein [Arthrobacter sp. B2a2-09]|uniref:hypothetical protein n=1 Tax=Arthrobacter sp. B2a2-09 TaxID=2952822 RepID=UPI0022CDA392|nr:hypothetical protein [Arthrobacter sp. B2a2-09]MCZ9883717.1 hypothetical protein [Arthrobacter sp. B2a2-09]
MSTVAEQVAAHIATDNPTFILKTYPTGAPENIPAGKVAVHVHRETLNKASANVLGHALKITLIIPGDIFSTANETRLEAALDDLLFSLESFPGLQWKSADRSTAGEKYANAYEISAEASSVNVYRPTHTP